MKPGRPTFIPVNPQKIATFGLLLGGLCVATPALAQKRIIETAPGQVRLPIVPGTNGAAPNVVRTPGIIERIYRPADSDLGILGGAPPSVSGFSGPSGGTPDIDPAVQQKLIEEQERRKNWAIEAYARQNRGETSYSVPGALDPGEIPAGSNRSIRRADLMLQAVDTDYARIVREQRGSRVEKPTNPGEAAVENAHQRAERMRRGENPNSLTDSRDSLDGADGRMTDRTPGSFDPFRGGSLREREDRERQGLSLSGLSVTGEGASTSRESGGTSLNDLLATGSRGESLSPHLDTIHQDRDAEFSALLGGTPASGGNGIGSNKGESGFGLVRGDRAAEFRRLLVADEPAQNRGTAAAGTAATLSSATPTGTGFGVDKSSGAFSAAGALPGRELPTFNSGSLSGSLTPGPAAPTFSPPPALTARPAQLPIPIRGQF